MLHQELNRPLIADEAAVGVAVRSGMLDGLTMKLPSCLSSWNGQAVRFTPALRRSRSRPHILNLRAVNDSLYYFISLA